MNEQDAAFEHYWASKHAPGVRCHCHGEARDAWQAAPAARQDGSPDLPVGQGAQDDPRLAAGERLAEAADRLLTCLAEFSDNSTACAEYVDLLERRLTEFTPAEGAGVNQDDSADWRAESPADDWTTEGAVRAVSGEAQDGSR